MKQSSKVKRSQWRGVVWDKSHERWKARIHVEGKMHYLGLFDDEDVAAKAYDAASIHLRKDSLKINFPFNSERERRNTT